MLAEAQSALRTALVEADAGAVLPLLAGGRARASRLAIHQRHFEASLTAALVGRFPVVVWLTGEGFVTATARDFVHRHPPARPCIAEYGEDFPAFLAARADAEELPWLAAVAAIEWHLGQLAVDIEHPPLDPALLQAIAPELLPDLRLTLQPGLRYAAAAWPVDDLIRLHLAGDAPDRLVLAPADVELQLRGARGAIDLRRLAPPAFAFRAALQAGESLAAAVERATDLDESFDAGAALGAIIGEGLVTSVHLPHEDTP